MLQFKKERGSLLLCNSGYFISCICDYLAKLCFIYFSGAVKVVVPASWGGNNILYAKCSLNGFVYVCLAMSAHHSCYVNCYFDHSSVLLFACIINIVAYIGIIDIAANIMNLKQIQSQGIGYHAEAGKAHGSGTEHRGSGSSRRWGSIRRLPAECRLRCRRMPRKGFHGYSEGWHG